MQCNRSKSLQVINVDLNKLKYAGLTSAQLSAYIIVQAQESETTFNSLAAFSSVISADTTGGYVDAYILKLKTFNIEA